MNDENKKVAEEELTDIKVIRPEKKEEKILRRKRILKIIAGVVAVLLACLVLAFIFRDLLIENGVRHIGTLVTGTKVEIASFKSTLKGSVDLRNIKVANPAGYQKPYAFEVDSIRVKIDVKTLTSDEPVVEYVEIDGVRIDMEVKGAGKSNLSDIQKNVEKFAGMDKKSAKKDSEKKEKKSEKNNSGPAPLIKKIAMTSMSISFSSSTLKSSLPVPLAPIYLQNIGGKGKPLSDSLVEIFGMLMKSIDSVAGTVMSGVELVGNAGKAVGDGVADGARNLQKGVKSISDDIRGLFKKK